MEQKQYDVFISYSRKDYKDDKDNVIPDNVVSKIKDALTSAGIAFWFDENGIHHGDDFAEKIVVNIESSDIFVFLSTENSNSSPWTRKEIACANELNKKIIPVRIDDSKYDKAVMLRISDLDYIDYAKNPEKGLQELLKEINHSVQIKKDAEKKKKEEIERLGLQKKIKQQKEIDEIESLIKQLEAEELTAEISRKDLILRAQRIDDEEQRDRLLLLIENCGSIYLKIKDREEQICKLEFENKELKTEINQNSNLNLNTKAIYIVALSVILVTALIAGILRVVKRTNVNKDCDKYIAFVAIADSLFDLARYEESLKIYLEAEKYRDKYIDTKYSDRFVEIELDKVQNKIDSINREKDELIKETEKRIEERRRLLAKENRPKELREKEFGNINGHTWVDLGLPSGIKWATCNIGANFPEEWGHYYAWGETETKSKYIEKNYVFDIEKARLTCGERIVDISGDINYDAARKEWGGTWRIPTKYEYTDLINRCICRDTVYNGVRGIIMTGPNGNQLFFPAAGYRDGSAPIDRGENCYYMTSTCSFGSHLWSSYNSVYFSMECGYSIRPITE